jgi:hypothetical protein
MSDNENTTHSADTAASKRKYSEMFLLDVFLRLDDKHNGNGGFVTDANLIERSYNLPREEAKRLADGWLDTYDGSKAVEDRVKEFMTREGML